MSKLESQVENYIRHGVVPVKWAEPEVRKEMPMPVEIAVTWHDIANKQPLDGQRVTLFYWHGQMRDAVRDTGYIGGFKHRNCQGWECAGKNWGTLWTPTYLSSPNHRLDGTAK